MDLSNLDWWVEKDLNLQYFKKHLIYSQGRYHYAIPTHVCRFSFSCTPAKQQAVLTIPRLRYTMVVV